VTQTGCLDLVRKRDDLVRARIHAHSEWVLLVVVDQRAGSAEGLVVVAGSVGVFEVLDLAVHVLVPFTFDRAVIHMWIITVNSYFTQNKIFFYGVSGVE